MGRQVWQRAACDRAGQSGPPCGARSRAARLLSGVLQLPLNSATAIDLRPSRREVCWPGSATLDRLRERVQDEAIYSLLLPVKKM